MPADHGGLVAARDHYACVDCGQRLVELAALLRQPAGDVAR